jgi:DNA-binding response OmpR family regulator
MKERILVVEDDIAISRGIVHNLEYEGYEVRTATHGSAALPMIAEFSPDLIILDIMLPGMSGFEILRQLREQGNDVHVIILSAKTTENDKVEGLTIGADDYVSKPFALREFLARVNSAMRRIRARKGEAAQSLVFGDLEIFPEERTILRNGDQIRLTPKACELLIFFAQHPNRTYSRESLIENVWHDEYDGTARTIDNFVLQIRSQIENNPAKPTRLETVHGLGYRFVG